MHELQLVGTVVFAISGVLAVAGRNLDWFGGVVVGVVTALGGGTMRGLILGITPVFWIADHAFLWTAVGGAVLAIPIAGALAQRPADVFERAVLYLDAAGLALFTLVGVDIALDAGFSAPVAVVSGVLTGVGGGVIRDVLAGRRPLIMGGEIYATAALAGALLYIGIEELTAFTEAGYALGLIVIFGLRTISIHREWSLPEIRE